VCGYPAGKKTLAWGPLVVVSPATFLLVLTPSRVWLYTLLSLSDMLDEKLAMVDFMIRGLKELRLKSYDDWPATFMDPKMMAAAGLYYTCHDDMVRCPFCKARWPKPTFTIHAAVTS
jgi:hypothetical protein